jgi:uncharacterized protein (TIGR02284 family)
MVTRVGQQANFIDAIKQLVELDYDAIEAYQTAIEKLENRNYKDKMSEFKQDHERHISELSEFIRRCGNHPPTSADYTKGLLVKGKVVLASMIGDSNILNAMLSNEEDTNTAYERMVGRAHESSDPDIRNILQKGLEDERKHRDWLKLHVS